MLLFYIIAYKNLTKKLNRELLEGIFMYTVSIKIHFNAAHRLKAYKGECENLHGHNWTVEITIGARQLNSSGMVIDFKEVKERVSSFLQKFDHVYLNELKEFENLNPTSENISFLIFKESARLLNDSRIKVKKVTIWETENNQASYEE
jgi:6-pyruvoyltetrahydropterin/6-carboxytetrahydropterin synthase